MLVCFMTKLCKLCRKISKIFHKLINHPLFARTAHDERLDGRRDDDDSGRRAVVRQQSAQAVRVVRILHTAAAAAATATAAADEMG